MGAYTLVTLCAFGGDRCGGRAGLAWHNLPAYYTGNVAASTGTTINLQWQFYSALVATAFILRLSELGLHLNLHLVRSTGFDRMV